MDPLTDEPNLAFIAAVVATDDELLGAAIALAEHSYQHGHAVASGDWPRAAAEHRDTVATLACIQYLVDNLREGANGGQQRRPGAAGAGTGEGAQGAASETGQGSTDQPAVPRA